MKKDEANKDNIDTWFFNNLVKMIIDGLITLLRLIRPNNNNPLIPDKPDKPNKPIIPLPNKPIFPWLRKKIDNILDEEKKV